MRGTFPVLVAVVKNQGPLGGNLTMLVAEMEGNEVATGHMGGADWGHLEMGPGTQPWVRGSIYKKKNLQQPGTNMHTVATIHKEILTPPQPPPPPAQK